MALPKRNPGVLKDAQAARTAADMSERMSTRAQRLQREADQLRMEGETEQAEQMESEASGLQDESIQQAQKANRLHKKAERRATVEALGRAPFGAASQYVKSYAERFINITNPVNRFQDLIATATPFTGAFSREKDRLMGGSRESEAGVPFTKIAKQLEESNVVLNSISRSQVKLIAAENETTHRVSMAEGATRDVGSTTIEALRDIKEILSRGSGPGGGGSSPWPDFGSPGPSSPSSPVALLPPPHKMTPLRLTGPASASNFMKTQTEALLQLVDLNKKQLDEMQEGDADQRLRDARNAGDTSSNMGAAGGVPSLREPEERRGGIMGMLGRAFTGIAAAIGGFFTMRVLPIFTRIGSFFAPLARLLGIGGGAAAATGAAGIMGAVAGAGRGAAARGGAGIVARALGGSVGGFIARRLIPGAGFLQAGAQLADGNYLGAALSGLGGAASFIPGVGTLASIGLTTAGSMVNRDTSRGVIRDVGNFFSNRDRTPADTRVDRLAQSSRPRETERSAPTIITTHHHHNNTQSDERTVIAQSGKSIIERSRGDLFAYTT